jgi:UDP-N-acetylglucosamine--N-acetylmuramyl-(pentapeptide) pyrophosphoryl-undecaprenol N-acetylglucosamine transferase
MIRRIAFAVGDTAGHVSPALAVAEAFEALPGGAEVVIFAAHDAASDRLSGVSGRLVRVRSSAIARATPLRRAIAVAQVAAGFPATRHVLSRFGVRLVIGTGGHTSGVVLLAARTLRLQTAIVEPNTEPGLANRLLKHVAGRAYVTSDECARYFGAKAVKTGTPLSPSFVRQVVAARAAPGAPAVRVLVTGGSRGGAFFAEAVPAFLQAVQALGSTLDVWHQSAGSAAPALEEAYAARGLKARVSPFIDDMAAAYRWTHFVIARAGANTIAELAVSGTPSLIVPLADAAGDHQAANAAAYETAGAALWCREGDFLSQTTVSAVHDLLSDSSKWLAMSDAARASSNPGATAAVVADCERWMEGRW